MTLYVTGKVDPREAHNSSFNFTLTCQNLPITDVALDDISSRISCLGRIGWGYLVLQNTLIRGQIESNTKEYTPCVRYDNIA